VDQINNELNKLPQVISQIKEYSMKRSSSFDEVKDLLPRPEAKTGRRNKGPKNSKVNIRNADNIKIKILIAARDCKNVSDLSSRLREILT
jgi:hypothetical protein